MVSLARAIAAQQLLPSATCLSHTSAALIHGLAMWTGEPDVYLAVSGNPRLTTTTLPAFRYPSSGVPAPIDPAHPEATPIRMHRRRLQLRDEEIEAVGGVPVTSVLRLRRAPVQRALHRRCGSEPALPTRSVAPRFLRHAAALGSCLLGGARGTSSGAARDSAGACGTGRRHPLGGLARGECAAVDDARGGAASGHCPVPGSGAVQGPLPGPGLAPITMSSRSSTAGPSTTPRRTPSSRSSARTSSSRWGGGSSGRRGPRSATCAPRRTGCCRCSPWRWSPASRR